MFEVICISGTPGTGKTTFSKKMSEETGYLYLDVNLIIKKNNLIESYDEIRKTNVIDIDKLNEVLIKIINESKKEYEGIIIDSHLSHYLQKEEVTKVIITKCNLKILKNRLEKRGYHKEKIRENLDAEIFDTCRIEALESGHVVETIITD